MFHIELTAEEQEILSEVLHDALTTLEIEIHRTDALEYKARLKRRRDLLKAMLGRVTGKRVEVA